MQPPDSPSKYGQTIDALVQQQESISQFPVTPEGRKDLIASHIDLGFEARELDVTQFRAQAPQGEAAFDEAFL